MIKVIPAEKVVNWLAKNDVAALIVKLVDYPELIRQGVDVLAFLGGFLSIIIFFNLQNLNFVFLKKDRAPEKLRAEDVCVLWTASLGRHEADVRTIREALQTLLPVLFFLKFLKI